MTVAIKIENVSKLYRLGTVGTGTIAHDLNRWWHTIRGKEDPYAKIGQVNDRTQRTTKNQEPSTKNDSASPDYVWALRDINLEVQQGDVLGIIGANGAGKSTLFKLISRITLPSHGLIMAKGRIASLLEVGTAMHPEMTARENVYLNGTILGMKRDEISRRFDDIIDFSGCKLYVDTPLKRFSSGMQVRLGFAVAAFLEPEILIVDEVLAVGDAEFQLRALGKMQEVTKSGRTVLFVSHSMAAVQRLCPRSAVLQQGSIVFTGPTTAAVEHYLGSQTKTTLQWIGDEQDLPRSAITRIEIRGADGDISTADIPEVLIECRIAEAHSDTRVAVAINDRFGNPIVSAMPTDSGQPHPTHCGTHRYRFRFPSPILRNQNYSLTAALYSRSKLINHKLNDVLRFTPTELHSEFMRADTDRLGVLQLPFEWTHECDERCVE
jgi:lipopolysaccharide transport system ATP-binding protein